MTKPFAVALALAFFALPLFGDDAFDMLKNGDFSAGLEKWRLDGDAALCKTEGGVLTLNAPSGLGQPRTFRLSQKVILKPGGQYKLYFSGEADFAEAPSIYVEYRDARKPLGFWQKLKIPLKGKFQAAFDVIPTDAPEKMETAELNLVVSKLSGSLRLQEFSLIDFDKLLASCIKERPALPFSDEWKAFLNVSPEAKDLSASIPASIPGADGKSVLPKTLIVKTGVAPEGNRLDFAKLTPAFAEKSGAIIYNEFESARDCRTLIGASGDWWWRATLNGKLVFSDELYNGNGTSDGFTPNDHIAFMNVKKGRNVFAAKILAGSKGWLFVWGTPSAQPQTQVFEAGEAYKPTDISHPVVKPGSALDLSCLADAPAGKYGRVVVNDEGELSFEKSPRTVRFKGPGALKDEFMAGDTAASPEEYSRYAASLAKAIRAQGYNFFRMQGVDEWVMRGSDADLEFSQKYLDRLDRLVAELKREGVYIQMQAFAFVLYSAWNGRGVVFDARAAHKNMFIFGREWERRRFKDGVAKLLNHVNPYTGLAWKDDPALAFVEIYNEMGIGTLGSHIPEMEQLNPDAYQFLLAKWRGFLREKYAGKPEGEWPEELQKKGFDRAGLPIRDLRYSDAKLNASALETDFDRFLCDNVTESQLWAAKILREIGYPGLATNCPMGNRLFTVSSWSSLPVVDGHTYLGHPSSLEAANAYTDIESGIARNALMTTGTIAGLRLYGRPFLNGEFNHCFWNPYQYELPLGFSAYAALNGWSGMNIHYCAVYPSMPAKACVNSFDVGTSPVERSGEFISSMLFLRGDVAPAKHKVALLLPLSDVFNSNRDSSRYFSATQSALCLLTNASVLCPDSPLCPGLKQPKRPALSVTQDGKASAVEWSDWAAEVKSSQGDATALAKTTAEMRRAGILPKDNVTDVENGVFQSETGELTLRAKEKLVKLATPKTEAATLLAGKGEKINALNVLSTSVDSLVAATAVDNVPLKESKRIVVVYSTRMANSGMRLSLDGKTLRYLGTAPVLMETGKLSFELENVDSKAFKLYALRLDGERMEQLPLTVEGSKLKAFVDTAALKAGPSAFFELAAERQ